jgi:hypothetical protein
MRGENLKSPDVLKLCIHFQVVGKVYKSTCFLNSREKARTIGIASGMLKQKQ